MNCKFLFSSIALIGALSVNAEVLDRPQGIKIGQRMTLRPYVSLSYTYDSNSDAKKHTTYSRNGSSWVVSPGLTLDYKAENWTLTGGANYGYHAYQRQSDSRNQESYGENLRFSWTDSTPDEPGWSLILTEKYQKISADDDMSNHGGRGMSRDRNQFDFSGAIQRRITERWHADVNGSYYDLKYDNNANKYGSVYGWRRSTIGSEGGYVLSRWTDLLISANHQWYSQDNSKNTDMGRSSRGYSLMGGVGTHATERISYRALVGWSHFEYGGSSHAASDGATYQVSGNWRMTDNWRMMLLASSYYQPSEREAGASMRVDTVSWGLGHSMIRNKLSASLDLAYRRESHEYTSGRANYDQNISTARVSLNYTINRFMGVYSSFEYQFCESEGRTDRGRLNGDWDYDRWRVTVGMRLTY